ncbi:MAG: tetratricopeptide repeat-containing sensor histidine kinase [Chloroflexota bacterium]
MQPNIQEFEAQLALISNPVEKIDQLNDFVRTFVEIDPHKSLTLSLEAQELAQQSPAYSQGLYDSLTNLAICRARLGDTEQALADAMQAYILANSKSNIAITPNLLNVLGSLLQELGEYAEALDYFLQALELDTAENSAIQVSLLINLGVLYHKLKDYDQELAQYEKVMAIQRHKGTSRMTAIVLNNIAMAYKTMQQLDSAVAKALQSVQLAQEHNAPVVEVHALCTVGEIYLEQQKFELALTYLQKSAEQASRLKVRYIEAYSLRKIGELYQQREKPEKALTYLQQALTLAEEIKSPLEQSACLGALAQTYKSMGNFQQALNHFEQFHELDKKIYEEQADRTVRQLQIVHQMHAIQQEAEQYKQKTEELDAYARTVAHDLKQPIAAIVGYADLLPEILPPDAQNELLHKAISAIGQSAEQADHTIRALLLLATVNKTAVPVTQVNMADIVNNVITQLQPMIQEKNVVIHWPEQWKTAVGYHPWLEEVWRNYLSNALKYSSDIPELTIGCDNYTTNTVRFWIKDNGPGIPTNFQANLFKEFSPMPKTASHNESHGLGLAIVKRIIEKLGGEVGYEGSEEQGSLFFFTLPTQLPTF